MFNSELKNENKELKEENEILKDKVYELEKEVAINRATYENEIVGFERDIRNLKKENNKLFTYNDAIRIVDTRLSYMENKFKEVKGSGLTEATKRYYYEKSALETVLSIIIEEGREKDKEIKKQMFGGDNER